MAQPSIRVYVRDAAYQIVDEVTDWLSIDLAPGLNTVGTWTLEVSADSISAPYLAAAGAGIVVRRDGVTVFSGPASTEVRKTSLTLSVSGVDDNVLLEEPARPTPALATGPYPDDEWVMTAQASAVIAQAVNLNIGPGAPVGPQIAAIISTADPHFGGTITGRAYFEPLIALCARLAVVPLAGGIRFRMLQSDAHPGRLEFIQDLPIDRTADAIFGVKQGTASDYEDVLDLSGINYWVVLGGDGFGANRTTVEGGNAAAIALAGRRITGVYDARGITDTGELNVKLAELLAGATSTRRTTITPLAVPSLTFGTDWDFGDAVTVVVDGIARSEVIRGVHIELTNDRGAIVTPTIGDAGSSNDDIVSQHLQAVQSRVSNLERNWNVPDDSITPAMVNAIDAPADNEILIYDSPTAKFEYASVSELLSLAPILGTITFSGNITIGGQLGVAGLITSGSTVQGTRLISTVAIGTAPLTVASTTVVPNLNASLLGGNAASAFALLTGAAFTGAVSVTGNFSVSTNALNVDAAGNKVRINSSTVSGWDLTVGTGGILAEGSSRIQGQLVVSTGGFDATGTITLRGATTVTTGGLTVSGGLSVSSGTVSVSGAASFDSSVDLGNASSDAITVNGTLTVVPAAQFNNAVTFGGNLLHSNAGAGIGFFGSAANAKQTITGSRGGNLALASLLSALANHGLITNSTTI